MPASGSTSKLSPQIHNLRIPALGNCFTLLEEETLQSLKTVRLRNGLPLSTSLDSSGFTVEMETGIGKVYVYLCTIFELNRCCGFTKFVIVVPSVVVKEGVYTSL